MHLPKFKILLIGVLLVLFHLAPAAAVTLTVGSDSGARDATLTIPVTVDDPEGIAGAAFTIVYDSSALTVTASSDFFDTFYSQFNPLATTGTPNPDGLDYGSSVFPVLDDQGTPTGDSITIPAVVDSVDYHQPFITNTVTDAMMVSAARCVPATAGGPTVLFSLDVQLNDPEDADVYPISIIPTTLNNTDAGYAAEGETIDLLIGSDPNEPVTSASAFPVILDDAGYAAYVVSGSATFVSPVVDTDNDGMDDAWEIAYFDDLSHDGTDDSDHDGYLDIDEHDNQTDPEVRDEAGIYIGYNPCTDSNALRQQVSLDADAAMAYPGGTIILSIDYDVSDGDSSLSGLGIYIHFDSDKATYTEFDNFLNVGDTIQEPNDAVILDDFSDTDNDPDTDKMMLMSWNSDSNNWPNQSLSVKLCDLTFSVDESLTTGDSLPFAVSENATDIDYVFCGTNTEETVIEPPLPSPPTGVAASDNTVTGMVQVTWNAAAGADSYDVYRADMPAWTGTSPARIALSVVGTSYDDISAVSGNRYYYWVKTRNSDGVSKYSNFDPGYWGAEGTFPTVPPGVSATDGTVPGMVTITWDVTPNTLIYEIWRADIPVFLGGPMTKIGVSAITSFDDDTVIEGEQYYYWVKARNSWGVSRYSAFNTGYIGAEGSPPPKPTGFSATDGTVPGAVSTTWNATTDTLVYEVYRATRLVWDGGTLIRIAQALTNTSYDDTSGDEGIVYYYWVKARNCWGSSMYSVPNSGYHD